MLQAKRVTCLKYIRGYCYLIADDSSAKDTWFTAGPTELEVPRVVTCVRLLLLYLPSLPPRVRPLSIRPFDALSPEHKEHHTAREAEHRCEKLGVHPPSLDG